MNPRCLIALLLVFAPPSSVEEPKAVDALAPFDRFVGGSWQSEGDFKVKIVYEWGLNKKLLKIKSYVVGEDGPKLMYESSVYWHPEKKKIVFQSVSGQGGLFDGVMSSKHNVFTSVFTSYEGDKATPYMQTLEFTDDDHVTWILKGKNGDDWVELVNLKEKRVKDAH